MITIYNINCQGYFSFYCEKDENGDICKIVKSEEMSVMEEEPFLFNNILEEETFQSLMVYQKWFKCGYNNFRWLNLLFNLYSATAYRIQYTHDHGDFILLNLLIYRFRKMHKYMSDVVNILETLDSYSEILYKISRLDSIHFKLSEPYLHIRFSRNSNLNLFKAIELFHSIYNCDTN